MGLGAWLGLVGALAQPVVPTLVDAGVKDAEPIDAGPEEEARPVDAGAEEDAVPVDAGAEGEDGPVDADPEDAGPSSRQPEPAPSAPHFMEPRRIVGRDRRPTGRVPQRFTTRPPLVRPALRLAPGFSARLTGRPYAAFGLDVLASVMVGLHGGYRQWGLAPELGYSLRAPGVDHQLLAGLGLVNGVNAEILTLGWLPRVVLQPVPGQRWLGMRNGLWIDFAENGFSVELAHQWLRGPAADVHELRLTLGIDLAMLVLVLTDARMAWL